jgi:hypothetical protein
MDIRRKKPKTAMKSQMEAALDKLGAEPLEGSGFEHETPDPEFSESEPPAETPHP